MTLDDPLYLKAINSDEFKNSGITSLNEIAGIYHYKNGYSAVLVSDTKDETVFAYIINTELKEKIGSLSASFDNTETKPVTSINFLTLEENTSTYRNGSWGGCMKDAIDQLYNDWEDDPVGTSACWLTGPLCVVGGGIACAIQTW